MDEEDLELSLQICSKSWCKNPLPVGHRWKQCDHCRARDASTKRTEREKKRTEAANSPALPSCTKKWKHVETLSLYDDSDEERPQRGRDHKGGKRLPDSSEVEDEELDVRGEKVGMLKLIKRLC